mgnify:CR=1 FL=1
MKSYKIERTVLPNGAQVVTDYVPETELVRAELSFAVGSYHDFIKAETRHNTAIVEQTHMNGLAHFSEHLIKGGHPTINPEGFDELLADNGLDGGDSQNLGTSARDTGYWAEGPRQSLTAYFNFISEAIESLAYSRVIHTQERGRIVEEMHGSLNTVSRIEAYTGGQTLFGDQIKGQWLGGLPETLADITLDDIRAHHTRTHVAENATFFTSGGINHNDACAWAAKITSRLPRGEKTPVITADVHLGSHVICAAHPLVQSTHSAIGFFGDLSHEPVYPALQPYFRELGNSLSSDVQKTLGLYAIWTHGMYIETMKHTGFIIQSQQRPEKAAPAALAATRAAVRAYEKLTPSRFDALKRQSVASSLNYATRHWFNLEARLGRLKDAVLSDKDPSTHFKAHERLERLERAALLKNVETILTSAAFTSYVGPERNDYPDFKMIGHATKALQHHAHLPVKARVLPPPA